MSFLEVKNLTRSYFHEAQEIFALRDVSFSLEEGDSLAICGPSGAGKSTLLNLVGGLDLPTAGEVFLKGQSFKDLSRDKEAFFRQKYLGFIFQFHHLLEDFTVLENVMMPLLIQKVSQRQSKVQAKDILQRVGLVRLEDRFPKELSGGEQQRVAVARALVHKPLLVLADEPTGNLDEKNGEQVFELLCQLNHDLRATLVVVTHQHQFAKKLKKVLKLEAGRVFSFD